MPDQPGGLTLEELKAKRLQSWLTFAGVIFGTTIVGTLTAFLNHQIQSTNVKLEQIKAEREYAKSYIDLAVTEDLDKRIRFADYLKIILGEKWANYHAALITERETKREELKKQKVAEEEYKNQIRAKEALLAKASESSGQHEDVKQAQVEEAQKALGDVTAKLEVARTKIASVKSDLGVGATVSPAQITSPRVYLHYAGPAQKEASEFLAQKLQAQGLVVPGSQNVEGKGYIPDTIEVRYFRFPDDREDASSILEIVKDAFPGAKARVSYVAEAQSGNRPKHYEVWFSKDKSIKKP